MCSCSSFCCWARVLGPRYSICEVGYVSGRCCGLVIASSLEAGPHTQRPQSCCWAAAQSKRNCDVANCLMMRCLRIRQVHCDASCDRHSCSTGEACAQCSSRTVSARHVPGPNVTQPLTAPCALPLPLFVSPVRGCRRAPTGRRQACVSWLAVWRYGDTLGTCLASTPAAHSHVHACVHRMGRGVAHTPAA